MGTTYHVATTLVFQPSSDSDHILCGLVCRRKWFPGLPTVLSGVATPLCVPPRHYQGLLTLAVSLMVLLGGHIQCGSVHVVACQPLGVVTMCLHVV